MLESQLWKELIQVTKDQDSARVDKINAAIKRTKSLLSDVLEVFQSLAESVSPGKMYRPEHFPSKSPNARVSKRRTSLPKEVRVGGQVKPVRYLNEILVVIANWVLDQGKALPEIPNFIHRDEKGFAPSAQTKQLKNGWWIEIGDDRRTLLSKSRRLLDQCGFSSIQFRVEMLNGGGLEG